MNTNAIELNAMRGELMQTLVGIDDVDILKKVKTLVNRCLKREKESEYIEKAEVLDSIREGLKEVKEARRTGRILMRAEDLLREL